MMMMSTTIIVIQIYENDHDLSDVYNYGDMIYDHHITCIGKCSDCNKKRRHKYDDNDINKSYDNDGECS